MEQSDIIHHELMYEAKIQFTGIVEYGVSIEALSMAETPIPLAGARFDQTFEGTLAGPRLRGRSTVPTICMFGPMVSSNYTFMRRLQRKTVPTSPCRRRASPFRSRARS